MSAIRILDPNLSNRIAAGEVVERPASVVKELVENSLDAGARRIAVFVEEAGMKSIRVLDDGSGMDREDAQLALRRHATSKIASERDLFRIRTLGFRGEALPSIAAVSKMVLKTRRREDGIGTSVEVEGGRVIRVSEVGMPAGTDVTVRDLFYNTPARLKYVKSLPTEAGHIADAVTRAALSRPDVAFVLELDGRRTAETPGDGRLVHAVAALYGRETAEKCLPFDERRPDLHVWGLAALPEIHRAGRGHLMFFVNRRPVRSALLTAAVLGAYAGRLPIHRFPVVFLHIDIDPGLVDPNVHPAKWEIRFSEEKDVAQAAERAIRRALEGARAIPRVSPSRSQFSGSRPTHSEKDRRSEQVRLNWDGALRGPEDLRYGAMAREAAWEALQPVNPETVREDPPAEAVWISPEAEGERDGGSPSETDREVRPSAERKDAGHMPVLRAVAQVMNLYIVAEGEDSLFLIDQHAAHEKILYERFSKQVAERQVAPMPLLVPLTLELTPGEQKKILSHLDLMAEFGFTIEPFGHQTIAVRTVPDLWDGLDVAALTRDLITEWVEETGNRDPRDMLRDKVVIRACRGAVKAGQRLSMAEMQALCDQLRKLDNPYSCPHGRPTVLQWTRRDLDKQFQRIQSGGGGER